jgi:hypothetical protein
MFHEWQRCLNKSGLMADLVPTRDRAIWSHPVAQNLRIARTRKLEVLADEFCVPVLKFCDRALVLLTELELQ